MKNTFRSTLKKEDFIVWERLQFKRSKLIPMLITALIFIVFSIYYLIVNRNFSLIIAAVIAFVICGAYFLYFYNTGIEKRLKNILQQIRNIFHHVKSQLMKILLNTKISQG